MLIPVFHGDWVNLAPQYTQKILNHRITQDQQRTFEALIAMAYPSNPSQTLSTIFLDEISKLTYKADIESYPAAVGLIVISMWARCIDEKYVGEMN